MADEDNENSCNHDEPNNDNSEVDKRLQVIPDIRKSNEEREQRYANEDDSFLSNTA